MKSNPLLLIYSTRRFHTWIDGHWTGCFLCDDSHKHINNDRWDYRGMITDSDEYENILISDTQIRDMCVMKTVIKLPLLA